jgi:SAM-dependent methyltransferase
MLPLARGGYEVTGVDSSPAMLDRARSKLETSGAGSWQLLQADLAGLDALPDERFGLAFCALNTWGHLYDVERALQTLRAVHRVLRPAGLLVLDLEDPERRAPGRGELLLAGVFEDGDEIVTKTVASAYEPAAGVEVVTIMWDKSGRGSVRRTLTRARMRPWGRSEMEQLLARGGYSVRELLGSWDLEEYAGRGERLIFVATRL